MMRRMDVFQYLWTGVILFVALAGGCGLNSEQSAQDTARTFVRAMESGDNVAMRETMTATAKRRMAEYPGFGAEKSDTETTYTIGTAVINGEFATVPVILQEKEKSQSADVKMRFEENKWRVHALAFHGSADTPALTFDFENPDATITAAFRGMGQAMGAMAKGLGEGMGAFLKGMGEGLAAAQKGVKEADTKMADIEKQGREFGAAVDKTSKEFQKSAQQLEKAAKEAEANAKRAQATLDKAAKSGEHTP